MVEVDRIQTPINPMDQVYAKPFEKMASVASDQQVKTGVTQDNVALIQEKPRETAGQDSAQQLSPVLGQPQESRAYTDYLNEQLKALKKFIQFKPDEDINTMVMYIKDAETGEVLRQVPMEEFVKIAKNIQDYLDNLAIGATNGKTPAGLLTDSQV